MGNERKEGQSGGVTYRHGLPCLTCSSLVKQKTTITAATGLCHKKSVLKNCDYQGIAQ